MENYQVRLEAFEGPMDLLMHLIEKNKIDLYDIPVAELTAQYLAYLDKMRAFNIEVTSAFLVMAATLLLLKSRLMLPKRQDVPEEEEDPREELVRQLLEYRKFKQISEVLEGRAVTEGRFCAREPMAIPAQHVLAGGLPVAKLVEAFETVLKLHEELALPAVLVEPEKISIEERMQAILTLLHEKQGRISFREVFSPDSREGLIMTFLALLELIRLGRILVRQPYPYAEISLESRKEATTDGGLHDKRS